MMIKNLSVSKELDAEAMHTLCGGLQDTVQGNASGSATAIGLNGGIGNTTLALVAPTQTNVNAPSFVNEPVAVAIAGSTAFAI
jgi:hypothetical protein